MVMVMITPILMIMPMPLMMMKNARLKHGSAGPTFLISVIDSPVKKGQDGVDRPALSLQMVIITIITTIVIITIMTIIILHHHHHHHGHGGAAFQDVLPSGGKLHVVTFAFSSQFVSPHHILITLSSHGNHINVTL